MNFQLLAAEIVRRVHRSPDSAHNLAETVAYLIRNEFDMSVKEERAKRVEAMIDTDKRRNISGAALRIEAHRSGQIPENSSGLQSLEKNEMKKLLLEVTQWHSDPESSDYNECDVHPCHWCEMAKNALTP